MYNIALDAETAVVAVAIVVAWVGARLREDADTGDEISTVSPYGDCNEDDDDDANDDDDDDAAAADDDDC
jgi:hypothetical protein